MNCDKNLDLKINLNESSTITAEYLLKISKSEFEKIPRYITFIDLRKIFDTLNIVIEAELVEYLIYLMKSSFKNENASFYDLNYMSLVELLYEKVNPEEEKSEDEEDQSYEITPEAYEKILVSLFTRIRDFAKGKGVKPIDIFKEDVALVEEENTKKRFHIIELKDFIERLDSQLGLDLKELEIYCLYTKLKFDEVENELEAISFEKLEKDLDEFEAIGDREKDKEKKGKLKLINMSKDGKQSFKGKMSQFDSIKQADSNEGRKKDRDINKGKDTAKNNKHNHPIKEDIDVNKSMSVEGIEDEDFISLSELTKRIKKYLENSNTTLKDIFSTSDGNEQSIKKIEGRQVISYSDFYDVLLSKYIIDKKLSIDELTEFIIVTESSEDIVIDINSFLDFINSKLKINEKQNSIKDNDKEKELTSNDTKVKSRMESRISDVKSKSNQDDLKFTINENEKKNADVENKKSQVDKAVSDYDEDLAQFDEVD